MKNASEESFQSIFPIDADIFTVLIHRINVIAADIIWPIVKQDMYAMIVSNSASFLCNMQCRNPDAANFYTYCDICLVIVLAHI